MTCPTCGRPVTESQRFCGNCGTDIHAANAYRTAHSSSAPPPPGSPDATVDYEQSGYDYIPRAARRLSLPTIGLIIIIVALLCFCCGGLLGGLATYWLFPYREVPPLPTPTPAALKILFQI